MLKIYLISVVITWLELTIVSLAFKERKKREGYKSVVTYSFWEKAQIYTLCFIPIFNIIMVLIAIFKTDYLYNEIIKKCKKINPNDW